MIAICGLPGGAFDGNLVGDAFNAYRNPAQRPAFQAKYPTLTDAKIKMVGVWDTVGSLAIPAIFGGVDSLIYGFLDTNLHPDVLNAHQALAIDERRQEFPPTLWIPPAPPTEGQVLEQVWFAGVHCDVGGGYPETGLSDITLAWMMGKAVNLGLELDPAVQAQYASLDVTSALGQIHESWNPLWLIPKPRTIANNAWLGNSVVLRCGSPGGYHPQNLALTSAGVPAGSYTIVPVVIRPDEQ